jgi:hypothetical protein
VAKRLSRQPLGLQYNKYEPVKKEVVMQKNDAPKIMQEILMQLHQ